MSTSTDNSRIGDGFSVSVSDSSGRSAVASSTALDWILSGRPHDGASVQQVVISSNRFTVGRHTDNNLCLYNDTVSGRHAELVLVADDVFVRDYNSTNGTLLNGRKVQGLTGLSDGDILHFGSAMYTLQAAVTEVSTNTVMADTETDAVAQLQFDRLLSDPAVNPFLQPIIRLDDQSHVGYEVLARSRLMGLETPDKMFRIASHQSLEQELSRVCRFEGLRAASVLGKQMHYYLNTHPAELETPELLVSLEQLRSGYPELQIVLEIHESAVASTDYLRELRQILTGLNISLAYDDFGSGQARLMELFEVPPDVLKFDIKFIHGLPSANSQRRSTTASLIRMVRDLGIVPLAEGVETVEEADVCLECGFELAQGFLFGRAEPASTWLGR